MKQNKRIAITGGIGSGKSTVAKIIEQNGFPVFSCDEIYDYLTKNDAFLKLLSINFGDEIIENGELNREKLSEIVFADDKKLAQLNDITHPAIFKEMFARAEKLNETCFFEVPLLFEGGYETLFDGVIVVLRDTEERVQSVIERDGLSRKAVESRIFNQYNYENCDFAKYYVIHNNGSLQQLEQRVNDVMLKIKGS